MRNDVINEDYTTIKTTSVNFEVKAHQGEEDEMISCYIPAIDAYFSATRWADVDRIAGAMIKSFLHYKLITS
jgi:hypothetical protein